MPFNHLGQWYPPDTVHPSELHRPHPRGYIYEFPIPPATKQIPGELLRKYYSNREDTRDWTDPKGVLCKQQETYLYYPQYAVLPIGSAGLIAKWPRPGDLLAVPVPVCSFGGVIPEAIEFRNRNRTLPSRGVSVQDIFRGKRDVMEGGQDIVLHEFQGKELHFIVQWPGYDLERFEIHTRHANGKPLSRFDLAEQITVAYARFFKKVETEYLLPSQIGFFNVALHQGGNSKKDSLGLQLTQLCLVGFHRLANGYWVAEVDIV